MNAYFEPLGVRTVGLLDGKVAVITGAGSGMAKASTKMFVREGAKVVAADISGAEKDTAAEVGEGVLPVHCDVTNEADVEALFQSALDEFGRVDALLNVAGIGSPEPLTELSMSEYDRILDVNLRGVLLGMKYGIRAMTQIRRRRHRELVVRRWAQCLDAPTATYSASKAGVIAVTKAAAVEYGSQGIRVNAICPGFILTEIMGASGARATSPRCSRKRPWAGPVSHPRLPRWRPFWSRIGPRSSRVPSSLSTAAGPPSCSDPDRRGSDDG